MKFWWRWLLLWLLLGAGLRGFFLYAYPEGAQRPDIWTAFLGVVNDLQSFLMVAGIVAVVGFRRQYVLRIAVFVAVAVTMLVFVAEVFFWLEFESRLDRLVFHYLAYPKEVLVFLDEQFYLSLFVLPFLIGIWGLVLLLSWPSVNKSWQKLRIALVICGVMVFVFGQPLGSSNSRVASEFVSNGYLGVLRAARYAEDDVPWLQQKVVADNLLKVSMPQRAVAQQIRREVGDKRHVILIVEESFAGPTWEDPVLRAEYLPNFSRLADRSLMFTRMFATGSRTTRGLEALLNGFAPLPGISTTERPGFTKLPSLARGLGDGGFYSAFLYGGWPAFSNFSNYWRGMGFERIWTREDFDESFETSWGVADGALFDRLLTEMSNLTANHERVFLSTLTVSHHRPYDFPADAVKYPADARSSRFAMAYADHALGEFFRLAAEQPWYKDTLFVVSADHGLLPRGDALIPVASYRIPLLVHAQGLTPRRMSGMSSSNSLPTTLMSLLGIDSDEPFVGDDLLCDCDTTVPVEYGYHIGLLEREQLHVVRADGGYASWRYDADNNTLALPPANAGSAERQSENGRKKVIAAFAPAYQWFYHNTTPEQASPDVYHAEVVGQ